MGINIKKTSEILIKKLEALSFVVYSFLYISKPLKKKKEFANPFQKCIFWTKLFVKYVGITRFKLCGIMVLSL